MYLRRFFKGNPSILLDKRLSHRAWEVYARLELMAGHTRKVFNPVDRLAEELGVAPRDIGDSLRDIHQRHPDYLLSEDGEPAQTLAKPPKSWIKVHTGVIRSNLPTWGKRLFYAIVAHHGDGWRTINITELVAATRAPRRHQASQDEARRNIRIMVKRLVGLGWLTDYTEAPGRAARARIDWEALDALPMMPVLESEDEDSHALRAVLAEADAQAQAEAMADEDNPPSPLAAPENGEGGCPLVAREGSSDGRGRVPRPGEGKLVPKAREGVARQKPKKPPEETGGRNRQKPRVATQASQPSVASSPPGESQGPPPATPATATAERPTATQPAAQEAIPATATPATHAPAKDGSVLRANLLAKVLELEAEGRRLRAERLRREKEDLEDDATEDQVDEDALVEEAV